MDGGMKKEAWTFNVQHVEDAEFKGDGLRPYFEYRDLGIKDATNGDFHAHIIRPTGKECTSTGKHSHDLNFQMVYVLKGWAKFYFEGEGEVVLKAGTCMNQRPGIVHDLLEFSDDVEMLEITSPAEFGTDPA